MPLNFPTSPSNNEQYDSFYWDASAGIWRRINVESLLFNEQTGTSYSLQLSDRDKVVELNNSSEISLTIPLNSSVAFPNGSVINILQTGTGAVIIAGAEGVTVNATPGLKLREQWSSASVIKRATDSWVVIGDLVEVE
jgi:hypothetical protein